MKRLGLILTFVLAAHSASAFELCTTLVQSTCGGGSGGGITFGQASGGTATRVLFTGATGLLADDADLTFSTDTLTATKIGSTTFTGTNLSTGRHTFGTAADAANAIDFGVTAGRITFEGAAADTAEHEFAATVNAGFDTVSTIPALATSQTFALLEGTQTFTGAKTFSAAASFGSTVVLTGAALTVGPGTPDGNSWISAAFTNGAQNGITAIGPNSSKVTMVGRTSSSEATLIVNLGTNTVDALSVQDNGSAVFSIGDGGNMKLDRTITGAGTTGNQTINKLSGTVNFAAAATSLTVTNSLVTTSSIVYAVLRTNDSTCRLATVVPGSGSFVINMTAGCNAETSVGFLVTN